MNNLKRFLALVLAMSMMLTLVPFGALAASDPTHMASKPASGETTDGEPFNDDASYTGSTTGHTNYRIPGIVMLNDGTLVASADIRYDYEYDGGGSDIVVSRSEDDGATWNYSVVAYLGDQGNVHAQNASTMMDPVIITDGTNLYLLYDMFPAGYSLNTHNTTHDFTATGTGFDSNGRLLLGTTYTSTDCGYYLENGRIYSSGGAEQAGYTVDEWFNVSLNGTYVSNLFFAESPFYAYPTSYACIQTSTDGGDNWSAPEMLKTKHNGTKWQVLGPGSGIVTSSGELAFTVYNSDNSISLVHGKSGDWTTVKTSAANNESSVVELSDGTIRAFVKNGSNAITYVDFTKNGDSYTAGSAVSTGITNTGWCMISSMVYSKKIDGKEVILVCCPASSALRCYGNVFAFTVDPTTKAMTKEGSYQIDTGYTDQFFAYSDMAELEDGTIALLYEDGCLTYNSSPWDGTAAGSGYSHIAYTTVDLEKDLGLTFSEESEDQETDDAIVVYVDQTKEITLTGNLGSGSQNNDVANVTWTGVTTTENYLQAQEGTTSAFTGEKTKLSNCLYTFTKVSEGSDGSTTWTISREMDDGTKVYVNAHESSANKNPNQPNAVNVSIKPSDYSNSVDGPFVFTGVNSDRSLHFHTEDRGHYWNQCSSAHSYSGNGTHGLFILKLDGTNLTSLTSMDEITSGGQYLIAGMGLDDTYYVMHPTTTTNSQYAHVAKVLSEQGTESKSSTTISITGKTVGTTTVEIGGTTYNITVKSDTKNITLDVGESYTDTIDGYAYEVADTAVTDNTIATIDKVEGTDIAAGKNLVEITEASSFAADKKYLIVNNRKGVLSNTSANGSMNWVPGSTINGLNTTGDVSANSTYLWTIVPLDNGSYYIKYGEKYLNFGYSGNTFTASLTDTAAELNFNYESFTYQNAAYIGWIIDNGNGAYLSDVGGQGIAAGHSEDKTGGSDWTIYEVVETTAVTNTKVTFTGHKVGTTTANVGLVKYNITVVGGEKDLELKVGETLTDTVDGVSYTDANIVTQPNGTYATLDSVVPSGAKLVPVSEIVSGKQYLIVNRETGDILTNTAVSATGSWENKHGLETTGKPSVTSTELWTITSSGDGYTIVQDGKYLTISGFYAVMSDTKTALTLNYTGKGWTIMDNITCASLPGHDQEDFYLSDNVGSGYDEAAMGTSAKSDYCDWIICEIDSVGSTDFTFTGVAPGTTTAVIGGVTYNITVSEDVRYIKLHKGQTKTFYIDNSNYTTADVTTQPNGTYATLDSVVPGNAKLVPVTEIVSGEQYLIANVQTGEVLTDTPITLNSGDQAKDALVTEGTVSVDNTELWTITGDAFTGYTVEQNGKYLVIAGYHAAMSDTPTYLELTKAYSGWMICDDTTWKALGHDEANYYLRNGIAEAGYTTEAMGSSITNSYSYWTIYKIDTDPVTEVTFTGVAEGETTATVDHVTFHITVDDVVTGDIPDLNNIVGVDSYTDGNINGQSRSDLDMAGKKITSLRITAGASFHLGVDAQDADVTWTIGDPSVATVDENGVVTAVAEGETTVTATVVKNGVEESIFIPVVVVPSMVEGLASSETSFIFYYIEEVQTTDPYYTMFVSTENTTGPVEGHESIMVYEGEVIWYERPTDSAFAWVWTADPWEGTALTLMTSTGSLAHYYPLKEYTDDGFTLGENDYDATSSTNPGYYYKNSISYKNIEDVGEDDGAYWTDALNQLLEDAIVIGMNVWDTPGCDGAMSNTRWDHDGVPDMVTSMTFISDPMPQIDKSVNGILPITRKQADFRRYEEGMVATVDEYVYFNIDITVERPDVWQRDSSGNVITTTGDDGKTYTTGAIVYSGAWLTDTALEGAYFYTKDLDQDENGVLDGIIPESKQVQSQDITDALNAPWAEDEEVRTLNFYLIYKIVPNDIPKFTITNTADLAWNYRSVYSSGTLAGKADAKASITVVGSAMENVVIDFGQSIEYTGLTEEHLKYVSVGDEVDYTAKYGTVTVKGIGNPVTTTEGTNGTYYNSYEVTYTPTSILQSPDVVQLYGTYIDVATNETVRKVINGFIVYPATTVYYEEGFMFNDASYGWAVSEDAKATVYQTFEKLGEFVKPEGSGTGSYVSDKQHPYGYDPIYANNSVAASSASSSTVGDTTTFTFTGTGFELYANSTADTGRVAVSVYDVAGELVNMYVVNTVAKDGTSNATDGQDTTLNTLPIVSVKDLTHGTYTVTLTKVVMDDKVNQTSKTVYLDGVRIINTVDENAYDNEDGTANSPFFIDQEDEPVFHQLRDYVLNAVNVDKVTDSMYAQIGENPSISQIADQIYANVTSGGTAPTAVITAASGSYEDVDVQDLLDNGPKNELYLHEGETLTFKVRTNRMMQIGLKAPQGSATYSLEYTVNNKTTTVANNAALNTSIDMFYELYKFESKQTDPAEYTITVTNNGSNILSVTDLKICDDPNAVFVPLTAEDIESTLVTMGYGETAVAENTTTGATYATLSEALKAAVEGETVKLLADCSEGTVMVIPGVTLDLNGFELTASYAVAFDSAHIVDNVGGGCVTTGQKSLVLDDGNAMVPVYTGTGYVFSKVGFALKQVETGEGEGVKINALPYLANMAAVELLKDGAADNNLQVVIQLSWGGDDGVHSQKFVFNDDVVAAVYSSNNGSVNGYGKMFSMTISGADSVENLQANVMLVSGTNVEYAKTTPLDIQ